MSEFVKSLENTFDFIDTVFNLKLSELEEIDKVKEEHYNKAINQVCARKSQLELELKELDKLLESKGVHVEEVELKPIYTLVSAEERERARFNELYKIRNEIVHNGSFKQKDISKIIEERFNVSERYGRAYKRIILSGCDELVDACIKCKIGTMEGANIANMLPELQRVQVQDKLQKK